VSNSLLTTLILRQPHPTSQRNQLRSNTFRHIELAATGPDQTCECAAQPHTHIPWNRSSSVLRRKFGELM
jgi:hypothetical protein